MSFGVRWRDQLPGVVADEFDGLVSRLRTFLFKEHNADGTHVIDEWADYQPTLRIGTLGNGRLRGRYLKQGRIVHYHIYFDCGTATALSSSPIAFTLPTPQVVSTTTSWLVGASFLGTVLGFVAGDDYMGVAEVGDGVVSVRSDAGSWTSAVPATWADGSSLTLSGWYECDPNAKLSRV